MSFVFFTTLCGHFHVEIKSYAIYDVYLTMVLDQRDLLLFQ